MQFWGFFILLFTTKEVLGHKQWHHVLDAKAALLSPLDVPSILRACICREQSAHAKVPLVLYLLLPGVHSLLSFQQRHPNPNKHDLSQNNSDLG